MVLSMKSIEMTYWVAGGATRAIAVPIGPLLNEYEKPGTNSDPSDDYPF